MGEAATTERNTPRTLDRQASVAWLRRFARTTPGVVALQKHDWGLAELTTPDSIQFFMNHPELRGWLEAGYTLDYEDAAFAVWRRKV